MNIPRATNVLEAWYRTLNQTCEISHPNIAKFSQIFIEFEEKERIYLKSLEKVEMLKYHQ